MLRPHAETVTLTLLNTYTDKVTLLRPFVVRVTLLLQRPPVVPVTFPMLHTLLNILYLITSQERDKLPNLHDLVRNHPLCNKGRFP